MLGNEESKEPSRAVYSSTSTIKKDVDNIAASDIYRNNGLAEDEQTHNGHSHADNYHIPDGTENGDADTSLQHEVDGKHHQYNVNDLPSNNDKVFQKLQECRDGGSHPAVSSISIASMRSPKRKNDASDAFPFNLVAGSSTSINRQNAPMARAPRDFFGEAYYMGHARRGDCVIINNRKFEQHLQLNDRKGSDRDASILKLRFEELGFRVHTLVDATVRDMVEIAQYVAEVDQSDADCFVMVLLSHGDDTAVYGVDGRITADKLYEPFKGDRCLSLAGKPKIFLTQACRGDRLDAGVDLAAVHDDGNTNGMEVADNVTFQRIPREADFLYSFSTVPGYFSWRNTENGSWYVQCLCQELQLHARNPNMDFVRLLTRVNRRVAMNFESNTPAIRTMHQKKQVPSIVSTLMKDLILNVKEDVDISVAAALVADQLESTTRTTSVSVGSGRGSGVNSTVGGAGGYYEVNKQVSVVVQNPVAPARSSAKMTLTSALHAVVGNFSGGHR